MNCGVSIVLPVYNGALFLQEALDSILNQSYTNFELLIINDGSTDKSEDIILSYSDPRIVYIKNERNLGLVDSLNNAIKLCRGEFIARMDADDISLPERLNLQRDFLQKNIHFAMVASVVQPIDSEGNLLGLWPTDANTTSDESIYNMLAKTNCIAHPSVMMRAAVAKRLMYRHGANASEDYDLWLRMVAHGFKLGKLCQPLLFYRVHATSITASSKVSNDQNLRVFKQKIFFLKYALSHFLINAFFFQVIYSSIRSSAAFFRSKALFFLRDGKYLFKISPRSAFKEFQQISTVLQKHDASLIFFFPYTHMGGAERVHANIVNAFLDQKCLVIFTGFSNDNSFLSKFKSTSSEVLVIPNALYSPFTRIKSRDLLLKYINTGKRRGLFGSNSEYYFHILPFVRLDLFCADLIHAFKFQPEGNLAHLKLLQFAQRLNRRVFVSKIAMNEFALLLKHNLYGSSFSDRLTYICNGTLTLDNVPTKSDPFQVLFVGRDSPEKRFNLFIKVANSFSNRTDIRFEAAGISISKSTKNFNCRGELTQTDLNLLYSNSHILLLTSSREGFPMVIMEAMALGVVPVCTAVGDIPNHLNGINGIAINETDENEIVKSMIIEIEALINDGNAFVKMSTSAHKYALEHFRIKDFENNYRSLFGL